MQTSEFALILMDILDEYRILDESPLMKITDVRRESGERLLITFANGEAFRIVLQKME